MTGDAVVVLPITRDGPYVLHPRGWLMNDPDLTDQILYAADRGGENLALFDRYPARAIWRFQSAEGLDGVMQADMQALRRIAVDEPRTISVTVRNIAAQPMIVLLLSAGEHTASCVLDGAAAGGTTYDIRATIHADRVSIACPAGEISTTLDRGAGTVSIGAAFGPNEDTGFSQINEYRVWYRNDAGTTTIASPAEQWRREPAPRQRWRVTSANPAIALSVG